MSDHVDSKLRELTYRLIDMAPEAPPYPEEPMVQLQPALTPAPLMRRRRPVLWFAAAAAAALILVGIPLVALRSGGDTDSSVPPVAQTTAPAITETTVPDAPATTVLPGVAGSSVPVGVYAFSDENLTEGGDPAMVIIERFVTMPEGEVTNEARATAAVELLLTGDVPSGFTSAIPPGSEESTFSVQDGVGLLDVSPPFESGGGTASMTARLAQVVFTATQFPEIEAVLFTRGGVPIEVFSGEGIVLDGPQTRDGFFDLAQPIFVETPAIGSTVAGHVTINGYANTTDGIVEFEITLADGTFVTSGFSTITCGQDCWGEFAAALPHDLAEDAAATLSVFDLSDGGSRRHLVEYPVTLLAWQGVPEGTPCSTLGLDEPLVEQPELPVPVAAMRHAIYDAAMACDIEALAALANAGDERFNASFGGQDALTYWTEGERREEPILSDLVRHLNLPFGVDDLVDPTLYFWPSAHGATALDELPAEDYAALQELYSAEELQNMYDVIGGYVGWRIGIDANGDWRFFLQGD